MRDTSLGIFFVNAPNLYPHIQGDHRSAVVFLQKYREAIVKDETL
jgi:hypothetical protein